ncbi:MAG: transglycosylase domain-containing protein [Chitinispirillaceae bacterium]|nr:transglycosylase domain-containing protein [Chitinispirillaceae bacterium]
MAALAAEDRRFDNHWGVDLRSVVRAVVHNYIEKKGYSGASTIAMQVARLQRGGKSNWFTKIEDSFTAIWLTLIFGKDEVLRQYLTIAPYGNRTFGTGCAARKYFEKPLNDLSLAQSALLISIPRAPARMNLYRYSGFKNAMQRARFILKRCQKYQWITENEYKDAITELDYMKIPVKRYRDPANIHAILNYEKSLYSGLAAPLFPLRKVSIDMDVQRMVYGEMRMRLEKLAQCDIGNASVMVVDRRNAQVLAYIGSDDYYNSSTSGAIDYGAIQRSTGSLLKPFIYALGMEQCGFTAATILTDMNFDFGSSNKSFIPENSDRKYLGPVIYKTALANSRNIPAVHVLKEIGVNSMYRRLIDLELTKDDGLAEYYGLGLSIGGLYCSLQSICRGYLALGNRGAFRNLAWFSDDTSGTWKKVIPSDIAQMTQLFLSDPQARLPTFPRGGNLEYSFSTAVKTGTSEGYRDAWCVAWSDTYLVGSWMGNGDNHQMKMISGYDGPAPLVKSIIEKLHPDRISGIDKNEFCPPQEYIPQNICVLTGKKADRNTPYTSVEYFRTGTEPIEYSNVIQVLGIDKRNKLLAAPGCSDNIEYQSYIVLPLEFESWAIAQGLPVAPRRYSPLCGSAMVNDSFSVQITWPRSGSRFFKDPEMPLAQSYLPLSCRVTPDTRTILWTVNGKEQSLLPTSEVFKWPMEKGMFEFMASVPGTPFCSRVVVVEIF